MTKDKKKYEMPEIEEEKIKLTDIIALSGGESLSFDDGDEIFPGGSKK